MTGNDRGRSVIPPSFDHSILHMSRACHVILVAKHSLVLNVQILKAEVTVFFLLLLCCKKEEFWRGPTFKICNFKPSEGFPTKLKWQALAIYETHRGKNLLIVKKTGPNLIPLKIVPIGQVDLNSKIEFAICHWS